MRKPSKWTNSEMEAAVRSMPYADRCWMLTGSIIEDKARDPVGAVLGLIDLAARMTSFLSKEQRYRVAERLRSCADRAEVVSAYAEETGTPS